MMKRFGFTLAEALITLGIVTLIVAFTIPTLTQYANAKKFAKAYKKNIALISQASRMSLGKSSYDFATASQTCKDKNGNKAWNDNVNFIDDGDFDNASFCTIIATNLYAANYYWIPGRIWTKNGVAAPNFYGTGSRSAIYNDMEISTPTTIEAFELLDGTVLGFRVSLKSNMCELGDQKLTKTWIKNHSYCFGYIDVNGYNPPNEEVKCTNGIPTSIDVEDTNCTVSTGRITDIFPVIYHDSIVEPASNAAKYVFSNY